MREIARLKAAVREQRWLGVPYYQPASIDQRVVESLHNLRSYDRREVDGHIAANDQIHEHGITLISRVAIIREVEARELDHTAHFGNQFVALPFIESSEVARAPGFGALLTKSPVVVNPFTGAV